MNAPPTGALNPTTAPSAEQRLASNRETIARWLAQAPPEPVRSTALAGVWQVAVPVVSGLFTHPGTAVLVSTLASAWARRDAALAPHATPPSLLTGVLSLARRHPKTALATVGAAGLAWLWWIGSTDHKPPL